MIKIDPEYNCMCCGRKLHKLDGREYYCDNRSCKDFLILRRVYD